MVVDPSGAVLVAGTTQSADFPAKTPLDGTLSGVTDAFVVKLPAPAVLGASCVAANECASGHCVDGTCCDSSCTGVCNACTAAKKGSGVDVRPRGRGDRSQRRVHRRRGNLRGGWLLRRRRQVSVVRSGRYTLRGDHVRGRRGDREVCRGDSAECIDDKVSCAPFLCGATACRTSCTGDGDCDSTAYCSAASVCLVKSAKGEPCAEGRACETGSCVDGVCCNTKCDGGESCSEPSLKGTCTPTKGAPRAGRKACEGDGACAGTCDGVNTVSCTRPIGYECQGDVQGRRTDARSL